MLTVGITAPARADTSGVTPASITLTGGFLSITVPAAAGSLGTQASLGGVTISRTLGQVLKMPVGQIGLSILRPD